MARLNNRAYKIVCDELDRCTGNDPIIKLERDIVLKRIERLRSQSGAPVTLAELRENIKDIFPHFGEPALQAAAKANRPANPFSKVIWGVGLLAGSAGMIWVVNLPYPMIRWPVAKVAPILLLPSYISMDHSYRRAVALVEQADQLVNQATTPDDFTLGEQKVKEAQKNLDHLPVWFLGYWPQFYCRWLTCSWQFTLDEFKSARANVGRMEAKIFQENNSNKLLTQAEQAVNAAKEQYQKAVTPADKQKALATWQAAVDQIEQIPSATLAGRNAQTKLSAYQRDFQEVAGTVTKSLRLIEASQQFAQAAEESAENPPHTAIEWQKVQDLWQEAISRLKDVPLEDFNYSDAQRLLANYQTKLGVVQTKVQVEQQSVNALEEAQSRIQSLLASLPTAAQSTDRNRIISQLEGIINQLQKVESGTTAYQKAQELLAFAQAKLKQLQN